MHRSTGKEPHSTDASRAARAYPARTAQSARQPGSGLQYGAAANDAFAALFDGFGDFDALAREATQAPYNEPLDSPAVAVDALRAVRR